MPFKLLRGTRVLQKPRKHQTVGAKGDFKVSEERMEIHRSVPSSEVGLKGCGLTFGHHLWLIRNILRILGGSDEEFQRFGEG